MARVRPAVGKTILSEAMFTPMDISSLAYWWRADLDVVETGQGVSSWACQKTGVALVQAVDANRPAKLAGVVALNNMPAIEFLPAPLTFLDANNAASAWRFLHDGTGMRAVVPAVLRTSGGQSSVIWATSDQLPPSIGTGARLFDSGPNDFSTLQIVNGSGAIVNSQPFVSAGTMRDTFHVYSAYYENGAPTEFRNTFNFADLDSGSDTGAPSASDPNGPLRIGANVLVGGGTVDSAKIDIPEIMFFYDELSPEQSTSLSNYMNARYA